MLQRAAVAPPRGPRGASPSVRGGARGGIQKRRGGGPARVDKDGDLVMDAGAAGDKRRAGRGRIEGGAPSKPLGSGRTNSGPSRGGTQGLHRAQQAILRGIDSKQANILESRITSGVAALRVQGLSSSKAASNPDGGLEALLSFLERKASGLDAKSNRTVKIKKVCSNCCGIMSFMHRRCPIVLEFKPTTNYESWIDTPSHKRSVTCDRFQGILPC
jgi:nuclear RNA export factor